MVHSDEATTSVVATFMTMRAFVTTPWSFRTFCWQNKLCHDQTAYASKVPQFGPTSPSDNIII